jgi:hypothetical protein
MKQAQWRYPSTGGTVENFLPGRSLGEVHKVLVKLKKKIHGRVVDHEQ